VAARGEPAAAVVRTAERLAPADARVAVSPGGRLGEASTVEVVVRAQVRPFGRALRVLPPVRVSARAVAVVEPGVP
jgi:hypothetical protein